MIEFTTFFQLILAFVAAVSARPGFYYAVSDPAAHGLTYALPQTAIAPQTLVYAHVSI